MCFLALVIIFNTPIQILEFFYIDMNLINATKKQRGTSIEVMIKTGCLRAILHSVRCMVYSV